MNINFVCTRLPEKIVTLKNRSIASFTILSCAIIHQISTPIECSVTQYAMCLRCGRQKEKYTDLAVSSDDQSVSKCFSKCSSIAQFNTDTSFVDTKLQFLVSSSLLQIALDAKYWKSAPFSNLPYCILLELTNNLITYSNILLALHFFSILVLVLSFSFYFCKLLLTLFIPVASPLFLCIRTLSFESTVPLLLLY